MICVYTEIEFKEKIIIQNLMYQINLLAYLRAWVKLIYKTFLTIDKKINEKNVLNKYINLCISFIHIKIKKIIKLYASA